MAGFGKYLGNSRKVFKGGGGLGSTIKGLDPRDILVGLGIAGFGSQAAVGAKETFVDPLVQRYQIARSKSKMGDFIPMVEQEDEKLVSDYFNVVKQFSPKAAANPLVAGALVNKMLQFGGVDHKLVQDLAKIQKDSTKVTTGFKDLTNAGSKALMENSNE